MDLLQLGEEQNYQRSGNVDDGQIAELGKQFGVDYICIVESSKSYEAYILAAKLVDVKTAEIKGMGRTESDLKGMGKLKDAGKELANQLLGTKAGDSYGNFTAGQRFGTFFLNIIPGLGSVSVMNDWDGAIAQWGIVGGGIAWGLLLSKDGCEEDQCYTTTIGISMFANTVFNIFRSVSYDKPSPSTALGKYGSFNMAVLPRKRGNGMAYGLMYNLGF